MNKKKEKKKFIKFNLKIKLNLLYCIIYSKLILEKY